MSLLQLKKVDGSWECTLDKPTLIGKEGDKESGAPHPNFILESLPTGCWCELYPFDKKWKAKVMHPEGPVLCLINQEPFVEQVLQPGDYLQLGPELFLVDLASSPSSEIDQLLQTCQSKNSQTPSSLSDSELAQILSLIEEKPALGSEKKEFSPPPPLCEKPSPPAAAQETCERKAEESSLALEESQRPASSWRKIAVSAAYLMLAFMGGYLTHQRASMDWQSRSELAQSLPTSVRQVTLPSLSDFIPPAPPELQALRHLLSQREQTLKPLQDEIQQLLQQHSNSPQLQFQQRLSELCSHYRTLDDALCAALACVVDTWQQQGPLQQQLPQWLEEMGIQSWVAQNSASKDAIALAEETAAPSSAQESPPPPTVESLPTGEEPVEEEKGQKSKNFFSLFSGEKANENHLR